MPRRGRASKRRGRGLKGEKPHRRRDGVRLAGGLAWYTGLASRSARGRKSGAPRPPRRVAVCPRCAQLPNDELVFQKKLPSQKKRVKCPPSTHPPTHTHTKVKKSKVKRAVPGCAPGVVSGNRPFWHRAAQATAVRAAEQTAARIKKEKQAEEARSQRSGSHCCVRRIE